MVNEEDAHRNVLVLMKAAPQRVPTVNTWGGELPGAATTLHENHKHTKQQYLESYGRTWKSALKGSQHTLSEVLHKCHCPFVYVAVEVCVQRNMHKLMQLPWFKKHFFLQDVFGHDYSFICLLASSAEMKSYQLLSSVNQMGSFPKTLGSCFPFKPSAVMGFCWLADYCLCCAGSLVSGGGAYGKESGAISMSLKVFLALAVC